MIFSGVLIFFWIVLGMFGESDNASLYKKINFSPVQQGKKGLRKHQSKYDNQDGADTKGSRKNIVVRLNDQQISKKSNPSHLLSGIRPSQNGAPVGNLLNRHNIHLNINVNRHNQGIGPGMTSTKVAALPIVVSNNNPSGNQISSIGNQNIPLRGNQVLPIVVSTNNPSGNQISSIGNQKIPLLGNQLSIGTITESNPNYHISETTGYNQNYPGLNQGMDPSSVNSLLNNQKIPLLGNQVSIGTITESNPNYPISETTGYNQNYPGLNQGMDPSNVNSLLNSGSQFIGMVQNAGGDASQTTRVQNCCQQQQQNNANQNCCPQNVANQNAGQTCCQQNQACNQQCCQCQCSSSCPPSCCPPRCCQGQGQSSQQCCPCCPGNGCQQGALNVVSGQNCCQVQGQCIQPCCQCSPGSQCQCCGTCQQSSGSNTGTASTTQTQNPTAGNNQNLPLLGNMPLQNAVGLNLGQGVPPQQISNSNNLMNIPQNNGALNPAIGPGSLPQQYPGINSLTGNALQNAVNTQIQSAPAQSGLQQTIGTGIPQSLSIGEISSPQQNTVGQTALPQPNTVPLALTNAAHNQQNSPKLVVLPVVGVPVSQLNTLTLPKGQTTTPRPPTVITTTHSRTQYPTSGISHSTTHATPQPFTQPYPTAREQNSDEGILSKEFAKVFEGALRAERKKQALRDKRKKGQIKHRYYLFNNDAPSDISTFSNIKKEKDDFNEPLENEFFPKRGNGPISKKHHTGLASTQSPRQSSNKISKIYSHIRKHSKSSINNDETIDNSGSSGEELGNDEIYIDNKLFAKTKDALSPKKSKNKSGKSIGDEHHQKNPHKIMKGKEKEDVENDYQNSPDELSGLGEEMETEVEHEDEDETDEFSR